MFDGRRILALIPARGGSKGLPGKNIRELAGRPLLAWSIEAARQSRYVDVVALSTDSRDIAEVAEAEGVPVPFLRPAHLATDSASSFDALVHALDWYAGNGERFDLVVWLQPTSPLRTAADIDQAIELYFEKQADAIVSVCETDHHPWWSNTLSADGNMAGFLRHEVLNTNRQELPVYYRLNGAIYLGAPELLREQRSFFGRATYAYVMSRERSVDIDDLIDFRLAECLILENEFARKP
ncbi:acylneuraminate cytidylyltransferase family protein [Syntrophotalea acetylenica]|uniref:CMP-N-acetlyneuraminic acid synthetase n=1 Tax=Syntrophotalea acetylenica TaxID=29542 RepID=A0A1L3GD75_SYNAC|nr:acylneuraminate cytidylyltransferase family protein [Syntrophotalea acetylenica]APG23789.1 CMP-N-acetlyneuraminic acid synthetase [Syntrophotalea acetylenica]